MVSCIQTADPTDMLFELYIWVGPRNHVLGQGVGPTRAMGNLGKGCFPRWIALYNTANILTKHTVGLTNIQAYLVSRYTLAFM